MLSGFKGKSNPKNFEAPQNEKQKNIVYIYTYIYNINIYVCIYIYILRYIEHSGFTCILPLYKVYTLCIYIYIYIYILFVSEIKI